MSIKMIWENLGIRVTKYKRCPGKVKYYIYDEHKDKQIVLWDKNMLEMCQAIIDDAKENESEE